MMLSTHFGNLEASPSVRSDVEDLLLAAVDRFRSRVRTVKVSVRDVNGPRGGIDKKCRCVVHLKKMAPIVIEDADQNYRNLFNRVAERVSYTLSQKVDRVQKKSRSKKSKGKSSELANRSPA
ncbi:hypothetical protein Q31b_27730 [Novipirellula aureliae]|uniref:Sigma 54 modulation protein / S30EA ribosomal protein n=1 Tax=Novipirellula aureliae TaxID=2527966 RepID=A0A5C6DYN1_9BACT|nr:hypothetical protein [Novipirellula aureliae]TWU41334.1 hypothetical protein Q31b_27730 [Novipirellula aureliae]